MKKKTKNKIVLITGISIMSLVFGGTIFLTIFPDPTIVDEFDTKNPNTTLHITTHILTGVKEYNFGTTDEISNEVINDPMIVTEFDTNNPRSSLIIKNHTNMNMTEYIYGIVDGIGNIQKEKNP